MGHSVVLAHAKQSVQGTTVKCLVGAPKPLALESWYMFNNAHQRNNITSIK